MYAFFQKFIHLPENQFVIVAHSVMHCRDYFSALCMCISGKIYERHTFDLCI